ncbi:MAG: phosphate ABC transporter permease PstA [Rhodospirillaceae bacterium]|nr:phosphate ABC transporter permease PstA [Rhodospirillaceae bacterium]
MNRALYLRRRAKNRAVSAISFASAVIGLAALALVLMSLLAEGFSGLNLQTLTEMTPPPGSKGGLLNAIAGSLIMTVIATLIGAPLGIFAGTYMAEYGRYSRITPTIRFINDILLSAPSIVVGLFVYEIMVVPMGHFSAISGVVALAIIVIPIALRTTEDMLLLVPPHLREAATALGAQRYRVIFSVSYKAAMSGLVTGVLLAIARISGETAPLLFTALNNQFWSLNLAQPMASLPTTINQFAASPYEDWQRLAWSGALLITLAVLGLNVIARVLSSRKRH